MQPDWQHDFRHWASAVDSPGPVYRVPLMDPDAVPITVGRVLQASRATSLIVTADSARAEALAGALTVYAAFLEEEREIVTIPELVSDRRNQWAPENEGARCAALERVLADQPTIFIATVQSIMSHTVSPTAFRSYVFTIATGDRGIEPETLASRLVELDYDNELEVHAPGEFARRGGILDVYSPASQAPVRVEFFGDEIDSMRFFEPDTQRSFRETDRVRILPRGDCVTGEDGDLGSRVLDYFGEDVPVIVCEPTALMDHVRRFSDEAAAAEWDETIWARSRATFIVSDVSGTDERLDRLPVLSAGCVTLGDDIGAFLPELGPNASVLHWQQLRDCLCRWRLQGYRFAACCGAQSELDRFRDLVSEDPELTGIPFASVVARLDTGVLLPEPKLVLLSERELFGRRPDVRRRRANRYRLDQKMGGEMELEEGSYAVHAANGICRYHGICELEVNGEIQDVMELEFDDEARMYVPLDQAHLVSRYVGGTKKLPRLSRLGSASWKTARASAESAIWDLAAELLRIEAMREHSKGTEFAAAPDWERSFAGAFPYTETEDQAEAIRQVLNDMASQRPMDRLLCGDVGYGKTEVAMRAAFRAVLNGRQVGVLVPTTVLAQQHFNTFSTRMAEYPVEVEMISRFRTRAEQRQILRRLAEGTIDIIIGTHRLLQSDVHFADLGLLVVDEEQRFGVRHKQKLKEMRASVDILTMTATPIPRTLYFSLSGLRNLSTIMTAPAERLPVHTVVAQYENEVVTQVIRRELERQGQVFFLHNRVQSIDRVAFRLRNLVPDARFAVGHGQMGAQELEHVMGAFIMGEVDVLVCTTIIESGIDIPNANTIIIDRADRFGLAELYQLRGRVGRYHRQAYAYLLLPPAGLLTGTAKERLSAIRKYTHLGAGFKLALRDLEIRGAGNILGTEQSGHIAAVGFELYCELLRDAVAKLSRQPTPERLPVPVEIDSLIFGYGRTGDRSPVGIPKLYVESESVRVDIYRRVSRIATEDEVAELVAELEDRFGRLPVSTQLLLEVARVRVLARAAGIIRITVRDGAALLETERGLIKRSTGGIPRLSRSDPRDQLDELIELLRLHARQPVPAAG